MKPQKIVTNSQLKEGGNNEMKMNSNKKAQPSFSCLLV